METLYDLIALPAARDPGKRGLAAAARPDLRALAQTLCAASSVLIVTGFPIRAARIGETDGPCGAAALAHALCALGKRVTVVTDALSAAAVRAACALRAPQAEVLLLVLNAYHDVVRFTLPATPGAARWALLVDTNQPALAGQPAFAVGHEYEVTGRSLLLLLMEPGEAQPAPPPEEQAAALTAAAGIVTAATLPGALPEPAVDGPLADSPAADGPTADAPADAALSPAT